MQQLGWTTIRDKSDAEALAQEVTNSTRRVSGLTGLGAGLNAAMAMFDILGRCAHRTIVNVSADGKQSIVTRRYIGPQPMIARKKALERGTTINALVMDSDEPGIVEYYTENVIAGSDAFVMKVQDHASFATALKLKLLREIGPFVISSKID